MGHTTPRYGSFKNNGDGVDFVCCRMCGDHRRVISGRHLSKHDTDRETYMEEYHLTPDELIAKVFASFKVLAPAITRLARAIGFMR
jgi:hypothetical protein